MSTRLLGIDMGAARIGLALSEHGLQAHAYDTIHIKSGRHDHPAEVMKSLIEICKKERIEQVVFGLPYSLQGRAHENKRTALVREFAREFDIRLRGQGLAVSIHFQNEQFTSQMAGQFLKTRTKKTPDDEKAAELILQQFIDTKKPYGASD